MTIEDRLETLEREMRAVRLRLGMELPNKEEQAALGVVGVGHEVVIQPNQPLSSHPAIARVIEARSKAHLPDLTPEEALELYNDGEPGVPMLFPDPIRILESRDHRHITWPRGWHRVPKRHVTMLTQMQCIPVPEDMLAAS